jgi:anthranilate synthase component 1
VQGTLKNTEDAFSLFRACFPAGTVSGAPKIRAMQIIEELEKQRRGTYAGSVGYFSYSGNMDMAITIRTLLFKNNKIYLQAGAGIVADSIPEQEEKESRSKAAALIQAVELAEITKGEW